MHVRLGIGFMGECEVIPGIGYVATRCFHVAMMPIVPLGTWFVFDPRERRANVRIGFSWRSYIFAWFAFAYVVGIALTLTGCALLFALSKAAAVGVAVAGIAVAVGVWRGSGRFQKASFARAIELGKELGVDYARLKAAYPAG